MRASLAASACVVGAMFLTSCIAIPVPERLSGGSGGNLGWKEVVEKREPNLLYAVDRTECAVGRDRFESVRAGERIFCHWRKLPRPPLDAALLLPNSEGREP